MKRSISKLLAIAIVGLSTVACIGTGKGNPLAFVPPSELALIRSSAPVEKGRISVDDLLANARASDKDSKPAKPVTSHLQLDWAGDGVEPEPGQLAGIGSFIAAAPKESITIACGSSLNPAGLRAHRRALNLRRMLETLGVSVAIKRDGDLGDGMVKLLRGGRSA